MRNSCRLAERNGSEVSVKMGKLLFLKAGQGVTASGKKIPQITITRSDGDRHHFAIADRGAYTGVTAKWLHTKDPKPQKQKVKLKRKKKEKHLRALEHPKAKPVRQKKEPKVPEAREGEYMAGEADNVFALTTYMPRKRRPCAPLRRSGINCNGALRSSPSAWLPVGQIFTRKHRLKCQALSAS